MVPAMYMKACKALVCMARKETAENVVNPPIIPRPQNGPGSKRPMRKQPMKLMMKMMMISAGGSGAINGVNAKRASAPKDAPKPMARPSLSALFNTCTR